MAVEMIGAVGAANATASALETGRTTESGTSTFASLVNAVEESNAAANTAAGGMLEGSTDVHDAMIALQRADMTLQLSVQIRNKLVQAYQEVMRMPV